jgi:hypothetical protein
MKAAIMTAPAMDGSTTSVADIDEPQPGPGQVAIDVAYAGVNFVDVMARRGDPGYASGWPYVPGLDHVHLFRAEDAVRSMPVIRSRPAMSSKTQPQWRPLRPSAVTCALWGESPIRLTVRQGEDLGRPSELLVDVDPAGERVKVTRQAVPIRQL